MNGTKIDTLDYMRIIIAILVLIFSQNIVALTNDTTLVNPHNVLYGKIVEGDTVLHSHIRELTFYAPREFESKRDYRRYRRLIYNIKKAYPYAKIASEKLKEINQKMLAMDSELERKKYMKQVEKEMMDEFEDELKKLTITQGRLLIKLIDRETGNTSYDLVKELRGSFSAIFWQALARIFGSDLKSEFDAEGTDKLINEIVVMIENGQL